MSRHSIPTATHKSFTSLEDALAYVESINHRVVVKASGLAGGKGVHVPETKSSVVEAVKELMLEKNSEIVIEDYLEGEEVSVLAFTDGYTVKLMPGAQDHKRIFDNDMGPNTGGMGAYAPAPVLSSEMAYRCEQILLQTVTCLRQENRLFQGVLYGGFMMDKDNSLKVLEFNCRFGDP